MSRLPVAHLPVPLTPAVSASGPTHDEGHQLVVESHVPDALADLPDGVLGVVDVEVQVALTDVQQRGPDALVQQELADSGQDVLH